MKYVDWILSRIEEPSTWAGGSLLAIALHTVAPGALGDAVLAVGASIGALLAIVIPEKK
jgi:hypothetical protein